MIFLHFHCIQRLNFLKREQLSNSLRTHKKYIKTIPEKRMKKIEIQLGALTFWSLLLKNRSLYRVHGTKKI